MGVILFNEGFDLILNLVFTPLHYIRSFMKVKMQTTAMKVEVVVELEELELTK